MYMTLPECMTLTDILPTTIFFRKTHAPLYFQLGYTLYQPWNCSFLFCGIYLFIIQGVEKTSWTTYYKFWRAHSQSCSKKHWQHFTNRKLSTQILLLCLPLVFPASVYQAEGGLAFWWQLNLKLFRGHQQNLPLKISYWWKGKKSTIFSSPHHFQCRKHKKLKKAKK